jgi:V8-like Glu-specific endopeptidase
MGATNPETESAIVDSRPLVCRAVRCVGTIKPQFDAKSKAFRAPTLSVSGTGFWLKDSRSFVTCAHVVEGMLIGTIDQTGMLVVGGNGCDYQKATIAILDYAHDLAILSLEVSKDYIEQQCKSGLSLVDKQLNVGEKVAYAGFPFGNELLNSKHSPTYSEGIVGTEVLDDTTPKTIQISGAVAGGYSGSPITLKDDPEKVIAVLANSPSAQAGQASIFRGISWKHVKELCELARS